MVLPRRNVEIYSSPDSYHCWLFIISICAFRVQQGWLDCVLWTYSRDKSFGKDWTGLDWTAEWKVKVLRWRCLYIYWFCLHCKWLELQGRPCRNGSPVFNRGQHDLLTYCGDSNPPILGGNLLFLLNIIRVLETLPFLCLTSLFSTHCPFLPLVSQPFLPFCHLITSLHNFGCSISIDCDLKMQEMASWKHIP